MFSDENQLLLSWLLHRSVILENNLASNLSDFSRTLAAHRIGVLKEWKRVGGVLILGYNLLRTLTNPTGRIKPSIRKVYQETLVDPGTIIVYIGLISNIDKYPQTESIGRLLIFLSVIRENVHKIPPQHSSNNNNNSSSKTTTITAVATTTTITATLTP